MAFAGKKMLGVFAVVMFVALMGMVLVGCGSGNTTPPNGGNGNGEKPEVWYSGVWNLYQIELGDDIVLDRNYVLEWTEGQPSILDDFAATDKVKTVQFDGLLMTVENVCGYEWTATFVVDDKELVFTPNHTELTVGTVVYDGEFITFTFTDGWFVVRLRR